MLEGDEFITNQEVLEGEAVLQKHGRTDQRYAIALHQANFFEMSWPFEERTVEEALPVAQTIVENLKADGIWVVKGVTAWRRNDGVEINENMLALWRVRPALDYLNHMTPNNMEGFKI